VLAAFAACATPGARCILQAQPACYAPGQALGHLGEQACVEGVVTGGVYAEGVRGRPTFLDFGSEFTAVIWQQDRRKFSPPPETLQGQRLRVSGRIEEYRGKAEIILHDPAQLTVVSVPAAATVPRSAQASAASPVSAPPPLAPAAALPPPTLEPAPDTSPPEGPAALPPAGPAAAPAAGPEPVAAVAAPDGPVISEESASGAAGAGGAVWPLVAVGVGLIGAGTVGVARHRLRRKL
jgi:hypothetical protein